MDDLTLRPWRTSDLSNLVLYANNIEIAKNLTNVFPHPYTEENGQKFIEFANGSDNRIIRAICKDDQAIGAIGLHPQADIFCKNAELGYWLAEEFWGQGIMTHAIGLMVDLGFEQLDVTRIFARPFGSNIGSQKALEKNNFDLEAKFEKTLFKQDTFLDEWVYAIRKS